MASFLGGVASGGRGAFVPRSRALTQCSLRHLLKKQKRPQRVKKGTAAVLRDVSLVIGHCFLLIGNRPRPPEFLGLAQKAAASSETSALWREWTWGRTTIGANSPAFYGSLNVAKRLIVSPYGTHVVAYFSRQAVECASRFHPSVSANLAKQPPSGPGWAHELKHDGYRLQIHVRDGRVRLFTMNGADWSKRYPRIVEEAARIKGSAIMDAEVVCLVRKGMPDFDTLHSWTADHQAVACAFDLLMHDGDDLRRQPFRERKLALSKIRSRDGIQYVEHSEGHGEKLFEAVCDLGLEGIVSKRLTSVYRSGPSRTWIKVKNPKAPAAARVIDGTF
jgi:bifunctional non-homologous end joining protein LigD